MFSNIFGFTTFHFLLVKYILRLIKILIYDKFLEINYLKK